MTHGTDQSSDTDTGTRDVTPTTVANPRRTRVDADGRPEPVPGRAAHPAQLN